MDNASKALIMAGAILIAVALVGVGVYLYQSAVGTVGTGVDALNAADMQTKNSAIEQFEGDNVSGTDVKQLIRKVNTYNQNNVFPEELTITMSGLDKVNNNYKITSTVPRASGRYKVVLSYNNGYVNTITITAAGAGSSAGS